MNKSLLVITAFISLLTSCSTATKHYNSEKIIASSDGKNERPFWTLDGAYKVSKLRDHFGDDNKKPKFAYFISQSSTSKENLIPNCYQMARVQAIAEVSTSISEDLKQATQMEMNTEETTFTTLIETNTKNMIAGAKIEEKAWIKIESEDDQKPYKCFIALSVPRKNLERLQELYMRNLEKTSALEIEQKRELKNKIGEQLLENY